MPNSIYLLCSLTLAPEVQREAAAREADAVTTVARAVITGMIVVISRVIIGVATVLLVIARVIVVMTTVMTTIMAAVVRTATSVPIGSRGRRGHDSEQTQDDEAKCKAFHFRSLSVLVPSGPMPLCYGLKSKDQ